jgi:hypothetical protein
MQSGSASPAPPVDKPLAAAAVAEAQAVEEADGEQAKEDAVKMVEAEPEKPVKRGRGRPRRRPAPEGSGVVMVKRDLLASCMTCPICKRLLREATTISECLHTCESPSSPSLLPPRFASLRHTSLPRSRLIWPPRTAPPGRGIRRASRPRCRRRGSLTWAVPRSTALTLEFRSI